LHKHTLKLVPLGVSGWRRFRPTPDGSFLALPANPEQSARALDARANVDGAAFEELNRRLALAADLLRAIVLEALQRGHAIGGMDAVTKTLISACTDFHLRRQRK
jgi:MoxR-like ATPase